MVKIVNTGDWPKELQPFVDAISKLDGDGQDISEADITQAASNYCSSPPLRLKIAQRQR